MALGATVGRVSIRVSPDSTGFRNDLKKVLNRVEKATKLNVKATIDVSKGSLTEIKKQIGGIEAKIKAVISDEALDRMRDQVNNLKATAQVDAVVATAGARTALAALARPRLAVVNVRTSGIAAASVALARLSGGRVLGDTFSRLGRSLSNLDKSVPKIATVTTTVFALAGALLAGASNALALGASLAAVAGAGLALPGILAGFAVGFGVMIAALKDAKTVLADLGPAFSSLQDSISSNFWQRAADPIRNLVRSLLPDLRSGLGEVAADMGSLFASVASNLQSNLSGGILSSMLANLAESIKIARDAVAPLVEAFTTLGYTGSRYLPKLAAWFAEISDRFNEFIQTADSNGDLVRWIDGGIAALQSLGQVIGNAAGIFAGLARAAEAAGGSSLQALADGLGRVSAIVNSPVFQNALTTIFTGAHAAMAGLMGALGPLGDMFVGLANAISFSLVAAGAIVGKVIGGIATALNQPAVADGMRALFTGILAGVEAILPVLQPLGTVFGNLMVTVGTLAGTLGSVLGAAFAALAPVVQSVLAAVQPLIPILGGALISIIAAIAPGIQAVVGALVPLVGSLIGTLAPIIATLATTLLPPLLDAVASLAPLFTTVLSTLLPFVTALVAQLAPVLGELISAVLPVFNQALSVLAPLFTTVLSTLLPFVTTLVAQLAPVLGELISAVLPVFNQALSVLAPLFTQIMATMLPLITSLVSQLAPVLLMLAQAILPVFSELLTTLAPIFMALVAAVLPLVVSLVSQLVPVIIDLVTSVLPPLIDIFRNVIAAIGPLIVQISTLLIPIIQALMPVVVTVFGVIAEVIKSAMTIIQGIIQVVTGIISGDWSLVWTGIKTVLAGIWDLIKTIVKGAIDIVLSVISSVLGLIKDVWNSAWDSIKSFVSDAWENITSAVSGGIDDVLAFMSDLPGNILSALGNLGSLLLDSGASLIQGFLNGIASIDIGSMLGGVMQSIRDFFPFSPAKKGPFSGRGYTTYSGKALVGDFAEGMESQASRAREAAALVAESARLYTEGDQDTTNAELETGRPTQVNHIYYPQAEPWSKTTEDASSQLAASVGL